MYVYAMFWDRTKLGFTKRNRLGVLEICTIVELFYEVTSMKKIGIHGLHFSG